jgi:DNA-binding Lrp family transcriptional regulator
MNADRAIEIAKVLEDKGPLKSVDIAAALGLGIFQITARLSSMEKAGSLRREGKLWNLNTSVAALTTPEVVNPDNAEEMAAGSTRGWRIGYVTMGDHSAEYYRSHSGEFFTPGTLNDADFVIRKPLTEGLNAIYLKRVNPTSELGTLIAAAHPITQ